MIAVIVVGSIVSWWFFLFCAYIDGRKVHKIIGELVSIPFCIIVLIIQWCVKAVEKMDIN